MAAGMQYIYARKVKTLLSDGREIALLDVREHGQYGEGHPLFAVNCPFSVLEARVVDLVPSLKTRVVVFDDADGVAERAAAAMQDMGYTDISILNGGAAGWAAAGYSLFKGVNVPSKAFGELVEERMGTPSISAEELKAMIDRGENLVVLDGRDPAEYSRMNIPTARSCPNAELGYRIDSIASEPETRVVINCAGRTRSIIGAQTLINLGIPNRVAALRNGSQGWQLAGFELEYGNDPGAFATLDGAALAAAQNRARRFAAANDIRFISPATLDEWQDDAARTTFVFDVRTAEEFAAGHLAGARHAPGGQLVQATDHWVAVRNARIVLCCDLGPRAVTTCFWLKAMGHDAVVLNLDVGTVEDAETGPVSPQLPENVAEIETCTASFAARFAREGGVLLDASESKDFRKGHLDGAIWAIRPRLRQADIPEGAPVLVCGPLEKAGQIALDLVEAGHGDVRLVEGTTDVWRAEGLAVVASPESPADDDMIDFLFFVHDRHSGVLESARAYLAWEAGLVAQMDDAELAVFDVRLPKTEAAE